MGAQSLAGCVVGTTRETAGALDDGLVARGASVVHVPLISTVDIPADPLDHEVHWVVVTSRHGAERIGAWWHCGLRCAAVGTETAAVVTDTIGIAVDVIPEVQTAAALVEAMPSPGRDAHSVLVLQGDLATTEVADRLTDRGYDVQRRVVYGTRPLVPSPHDVDRLLRSDVITFASGSAVRAFAALVGERPAPPVAVIGPSTAAVANAVGVRVDAVASPHSVDGLVHAVTTLSIPRHS